MTSRLSAELAMERYADPEAWEEYWKLWCGYADRDLKGVRLRRKNSGLPPISKFQEVFFFAAQLKHYAGCANKTVFIRHHQRIGENVCRQVAEKGTYTIP